MPCTNAVGADLGAERDRGGQVRGVHGHLRAVPAALVARAARHTRVPQAVVLLHAVLGGQAHGCVGRGDPQRSGAAHHHVRRGVPCGRAHAVATSGVPRVVRGSGDADVVLGLFDPPDELGVLDRPVLADAGVGAEPDVVLVRTWREGTPVQRRPADARPAVVRAERGRGAAAADALVHPVDVTGSLDLVGRVVLGFGVRAGLEGDDPQTASCQGREQRSATRARPDDDGVDDLVLGVPALVVQLHRAAPAGSHASRCPAPRSRKPCLRTPSPPLAKPS